MFQSWFTTSLLLLILALRLAVVCGVEPPPRSSNNPPDTVAEAGFERHSKKLPDATLSYVVRQATGPTLVLIPGSFDRAESWLGVVAKLDPQFQVVIVELRGHGESWPPPTTETGTIEQFAKDVFACTDDAGLQSFYVGGHSIGGMVAIECARQQPARLRGVLSIEGWTRSLALARALQGRTDNTLSPEQKQQKTVLRRPTTSRWQPEQLSAFAQIWQHWNGAEILQQTNLPILELWGDRGDTERPTREALFLPERPNIELVWITGASHFLPLERPTNTAAAMNDFIRKVEAAPAAVEHFR
jgi:pimeloyl-ACP methyl ester carboxylesterase